MYQELSIREERDIEQERAVARLAKREAKSHVLDVLAVVEQQLARIRFNVDPGHDGKHLRLPAVEQGESLVEVIREVLPEVIDLDYQAVVNDAYDDDSQSLSNEEYVIDDVRGFIKQLLGNLKVKP